MSVGVSMTNSSYSPNSRYNALHISKVMIPLVHRAHDVGLIGLAPGSEFAGRTTRIWAEDALVHLFRQARFGLLDIGTYYDQETVVLSLGGGRWIDYQDTDVTIQSRKLLSSYNELMHGTFVDIPTLETPILNLPSRRKLSVSQNDKFSKRVFYRSLDLGGRVHGGFWQRMPKSWRKALFINDLPTIEDDYSGLHIALLYGLEGEAVEGDPYTLDIATPYQRDELRRVVKGLALMSINARSEASAFQAFRGEEKIGSPFKRLKDTELRLILDAFKGKHPAIARYMCSDQGVSLMAIDGRMTMRVIKQFTTEQVPVLSLFDSYVIDAFRAPELRLAMIAAMDAEVPGASTSFKRIGVGYDQLNAGAEDNIDGLLWLPKELMGDVVRTEGYLARRDQFYRWRSNQPDWENHKTVSIDRFIESL